jgi:succinate-semialdehyde dehydrogenase/glutarate-semialdehyde dehydrogenase
MTSAVHRAATLETAIAGAVPADLLAHLTAAIRAQPGADTLEPNAPFLGRPVFAHPVSTVSDVDDAFAEARRAQAAWAARPVSERARIIGKVHHLAMRRRDELLDLLQIETGKSRYDAFQEFAAVPVYARYISRSAERVLAPQRRLGLVPVLTRAEVSFQPKGVVGIVSAWNYPAVFAAADGFSALVAGNAVVHRPAMESALSAIWVRQLAVECGVPEEVWQVVVGAGSVIGNAITERCDHIAFTGSTAVGRRIAAQAGERLVGISLELGGKNPFVVLPDADLSKAAAALLRACFINAGQSCVGPERILIDQRVYGPFREVLRQQVKQMSVGAALSYDYEMGSLLDADQLETVQRHVDDALSNGATVLVGGNPLPEVGPCFFEPTVLEDVRPGMLACTEETFGPVVALYPYASEDELIDLANGTDFGLHAVIWGDAKEARRLARRIKAGTVEINEGIVATWGSADLPQGGMKASGMGRRNGPEGILRYTEPQSVVTQRFVGLGVPGPVTSEVFAAVMTNSFRALYLTGRR